MPSKRTPRMTAWQSVVSARRLYEKGDGWWEIWLACGHGAAVLHGATSPLGAHAKCFLSLWRQAPSPRCGVCG